MSILFPAMPCASRLAVAIAAATMVVFPVAAADAGTGAAQVPHAEQQSSEEAVATLDVVEVRATTPAPLEVERSLTPGAVSVVDGETFRERTVTHMADALRYVPGVWTESGTGGDAIFLSSRGSNLDATGYDGNGIKLFQDGLPVTTADGNNHNRFLDPVAARQVVVARGANALTFGASTLGGAIDFLSPNARNSPPGEAVFQGGSHGLRSGRLTAGGVSGAVDGMATVEILHRDGYREHSRQERSGLYANAGWQAAEDIELRVFATRVDSKEQLAGSLTRAQFEADPMQANPSAITGNFQLNVRTDRLAARGTWAIDPDSQLEFGASHEDQSLYHPIVDQVLVDFDGPGPNPPREVFSLLKDIDQRTLAGMLRYNVRTGDHDVLLGLNVADTRERGGNHRNAAGLRNGRTEVIDNHSDSIEAFVVDRWSFSPGWTLVYGAQGVLAGRDVRTTRLSDGGVRNPRAEYSSFNPRIGVIYSSRPGREFFASASRLYEAPTVFELEDDRRGNGSTLEAMHGTVVEAGLRGRTEAHGGAAWHWDASVYYARIGDEILSVDDPAAPGTSLSANVARTVHSGIEVLAGASLPFGNGGYRIEPLVSATYNAFSFDGDPVYGNNDLPAAPDYAVRGEVMLRGEGGFFAGPTFDLVGARHADFANTYRVGAYQVFGLRVGVDRERWSVFGEVRNLRDEAYVGMLGVRDRAGPDAALLQAGEPRSVHGGIRFRF